VGDKIEKNEWAGHVVQIGVERSVYRFLMGKPEGKTPPKKTPCIPGFACQIHLRGAPTSLHLRVRVDQFMKFSFLEGRKWGKSPATL
jgi:hypothetical protein